MNIFATKLSSYLKNMIIHKLASDCPHILLGSGDFKTRALKIYLLI